MTPLRLRPPDNWIEHIPFAAWLVKTVRPACIVELGVHTGNSYFCFCQAVKEGRLETKCYGIDLWEGDVHAGFYGKEVEEDCFLYNREHYANFSRLIKSDFNGAVGRFEDGSIDLLHIDGLHTYEAVKNDFETWLPKLSSTGIVLLHDTRVLERGFGVWRYFRELQDRYPHFEFKHSYGLGVVATGGDVHPVIKQMCSLEKNDTVQAEELLRYYEEQGRQVRLLFQAQELKAVATEKNTDGTPTFIKRLGNIGRKLEKSVRRIRKKMFPPQAGG